MEYTGILTEDQMLEIISRDAGMLQVWEEEYEGAIFPTQKVYDLAVERNSSNLEYVPPKYQHENMCLKAVRDDFRNLKHVHSQSLKIVDAAFAEYEFAQSPQGPSKYRTYATLYSPMSFLRNPNKENCMIAVSHWAFLINEVPASIVDDDIRIAAIEQNSDVFGSLNWGFGKQSERVALAAVSKDGMNLHLVENQSLAICRAAIENNPDAIKYVRDKSMREEIQNQAKGQRISDEEVLEEAHNLPDIFEALMRDETYFGGRSKEFYNEILWNNTSCFRYIPNEFKDDEMCLFAVKRDFRNLKYVPNQTPKLIDAAFKEYKNALDCPAYAHEQYGPDMMFSPLTFLREITKENCMIALNHYAYLINQIPENLIDDEMRQFANEKMPQHSHLPWDQWLNDEQDNRPKM